MRSLSVVLLARCPCRITKYPFPSWFDPELHAPKKKLEPLLIIGLMTIVLIEKIANGMKNV